MFFIAFPSKCYKLAWRIIKWKTQPELWIKLSRMPSKPIIKHGGSAVEHDRTANLHLREEDVVAVVHWFPQSLVCTNQFSISFILGLISLHRVFILFCTSQYFFLAQTFLLHFFASGFALWYQFMQPMLKYLLLFSLFELCIFVYMARTPYLLEPEPV